MLRKAIDLLKPYMRPSLIVIGAQKGGTSTMYHLLRQHPKVLAPQIKELDFFVNEEQYAKGLDHYWAKFPKRPIRQPDMITFEASPSYLYSAQVAAPRIKAALPRVVCLALLRDPVKRAYSSWNMYRDFKDDPIRRHLHDPRTFEQAIEDELNGITEKPWHLYLKRGKYAEQLSIYLKHFPKDQLLVHGFKELKHDPHALMGVICERLGLKNIPAEARILTAKANARSYPAPIDPAVEDHLYTYFAPELEKLDELLGRQMDLVERKAKVH